MSHLQQRQPTPISALCSENRNNCEWILDTEQFVSRIVLSQLYNIYNSQILLFISYRQVLSKLASEMRKSYLLVVLTVFILLVTYKVESHRRRKRYKTTQRPTHKPTTRKPKPTRRKHCHDMKHCEVTQWCAWSKCSVACGTSGVQTRSRQVGCFSGSLLCFWRI